MSGLIPIGKIGFSGYTRVVTKSLTKTALPEDARLDERHRALEAFEALPVPSQET